MTTGRAAGSGQHEHVFLACTDSDGDGIIDRLIVAAPWAGDRSARSRQRDRATFDRIVSALEVVRAGALGVIKLNVPVAPQPGDHLVGPAFTWKSYSPYRPTRHAKRRKELAARILEDVLLECGRRGLPRPEVELLGFTSGPNGGEISAEVRLCFSVAVQGPVMLGRDSHFGGGLFLAEPT
jgi:CRISPR-associated protein Csb2